LFPIPPLLHLYLLQIPPEVVFDMPTAAEENASSSSSASVAAGPSAKGEVAFLSHETTFTAPGFRRAAGGE
jgi:hypothetical protein